MARGIRHIDRAFCLRRRNYTVALRSETERSLQNLFQPSNAALAHLTGLDLTSWRYVRGETGGDPQGESARLNHPATFPKVS